MGQHTSLTLERWRSFSLDQQLLMIANEMNRASKLLAPENAAHLKLAYERSLQLTDLTVEVQTRRPLRRELLRWRDLIARLYVEPHSDHISHAAALRCLLLFTPRTAVQLAHLTMPAPA